MKKHLIDIAPAPASILAAITHFNAVRAELGDVLHSLENSERLQYQKLGASREAWCMEIAEIARRHPAVVPSGISLATLESHIAARETILPLLALSREFTRQLEDTCIMLGVDILSDTRGIYKYLQIVADFHGLEESVARLRLHLARSPRKKENETTTGTPTEPTNTLDTSASSTPSNPAE